MRQLRLLLLAFFVVVAAIFGVSRIREKMNSDERSPVIRAEADTIEVPLSATDEDLLAGLTATDNLDGDVSDTLMVVSKSKLIAKGTVMVNYAAFDKNNNVGVYSRRVVYTDYISPRFHLSQPMRFLSGSSGYDFLERVTAEDCLDGDITRQVKISAGDKKTISDTVSEQTVDLQVTNSAGDTSELELVVRLEDFATYNRQVPALKEYLVYVKQGGSLNLKSLVTGIWTGGKTKAFSETQYTLNNVIVNQDNLKLNEPGVYTVTYELYETYDEYYEEVSDYVGETTLIVVGEE